MAVAAVLISRPPSIEQTLSPPIHRCTASAHLDYVRALSPHQRTPEGDRDFPSDQYILHTGAAAVSEIWNLLMRPVAYTSLDYSIHDLWCVRFLRLCLLCALAGRSADALLYSHFSGWRCQKSSHSRVQTDHTKSCQALFALFPGGFQETNFQKK